MAAKLKICLRDGNVYPRDDSGIMYVFSNKSLRAAAYKCTYQLTFKSFNVGIVCVYTVLSSLRKGCEERNNSTLNSVTTRVI